MVGKDSWIESYDALIYPVDTVFDEGNNVYKLRTKPEEIYKAWEINIRHNFSSLMHLNFSWTRADSMIYQFISIIVTYTRCCNMYN